MLSHSLLRTQFCSLIQFFLLVIRSSVTARPYCYLSLSVSSTVLDSCHSAHCTASPTHHLSSDPEKVPSLTSVPRKGSPHPSRSFCTFLLSFIVRSWDIPVLRWCWGPRAVVFCAWAVLVWQWGTVCSLWLLQLRDSRLRTWSCVLPVQRG